LMTEAAGYSLQNENGLRSDFRADAIAGKNRKIQEHFVIRKFTDCGILKQLKATNHSSFYTPQR
jgi:hypothetical protein